MLVYLPATARRVTNKFRFGQSPSLLGNRGSLLANHAFVEELVPDALAISVTTRDSYRADRYVFVSDTMRFLRLNLVMDRFRR